MIIIKRQIVLSTEIPLLFKFSSSNKLNFFNIIRPCKSGKQ